MKERKILTPGFILRDFWRFLKKPDYKEQSQFFSLRAVLLLFLVCSFLHILSILLEVFGFRPLLSSILGGELGRQTQPYYGLADWLIGSLVSAPIFEELAYRCGLRFSPLKVAVSVGLITFYWLPFGGTYATRIIEVADQPGFYLMLGSALVVGLTAYALLSVPYFKQTAAGWWRRNFAWVYCFSSLLFGLMHIFNVRDITPTVAGLAVFITFQQIVFSFFNGYVRMRYGFGQAVVQHSLFNLVFVLIHLGDY